ncbi:MAG TPA: fibronectin type III domain-containing protein [Jatrophihabitans sp.]|uniref:fibronectin type III domain-containing protein n=1 Tax=Jatrophihabitans sp. TaxID=1932789 RepID=UPI002F1EC2D4
MRAGVVLAAVSSIAASTFLAAPSASAHSSTLMRYPYLTDLTTTSVQVTFDTSVKVASAANAVQWGTPSGTTGCTLTSKSVTSSNNTVNAPITVAGVVEYQTSIRITGLTAGATYCYRIFTGGSAPVDLLETDVAPRFTTMGHSGEFSFAVLGDWGDNSIAGGLNQKNVDAQLAKSGVKFAVSTGDIAYQNGSQDNYGNLVATGPGVSQVFGADYWKAPGASIPLFATSGNHGRNAIFLSTWKQAATVAASNGKYVMETYSGIDDTNPASYPSVWYAFNSGGARFYILNADWSSSNVGTAPGGAYQVDRDYHWQTTSPEYQWLKADLEANTNSVKFAFFHYPLRADSATEGSDVYLQNDPNTPTSIDSLEGLLANNGVDLAFNGHAHIYQRNYAPPGGVTSYVTGGGGAKVAPVSGCDTTDAYAIGWSNSSASGSRCGAAERPTSDAQVYHFLKVTVNGATVTVTPTDSTGAPFDPVTYNFTRNTTAPAAPTGLAAATSGTAVRLTWTASASSDSSAQDIYRNGRWLATVGPNVTSYSDAAPVAGASYTVRAHDLLGNQSGDSAPATVPGGTTDTTPPSAPGNLTATATGPTSVNLSWTASSDNVGVTGYEVYRNSASTPLATLSAGATSYTDTTAAAEQTYTYTVRAKDAAGNGASATSAPVTTPPATSGATATAMASDDVTIAQSTPTTQPSATATRVSADGSPVTDAVLQFKPVLPAGCTTVTKVQLSLTVGSGTDNGSVKGGDFYLTDNRSWAQAAVNWNTAPPRVGSAIHVQGAVALSQTITIDLTGKVDVTQPFTIRVGNTSGDAAAYYSKEGSATLGPRLSVTC